MEIIFRVDASYLIGSGHVSRCLVLAKHLENYKKKITFITRSHPGNLDSLIKQNGFKVKSLNKIVKKDSDNFDPWLNSNQEEDFLETKKYFDKNVPEWLIVDHYSLDIKWEQKIRKYVKNIMVIDDLANREHDCDVLLDHNWFEEKELRYNDLIPRTSIRLLGLEYLLIKESFKKNKIKKIQSKSISRVFVFFGGSDQFNLTEMVLNAFNSEKLKHIRLDIAVGENNSSLITLKKLVDNRKLTNLFVNINNIVPIMRKADLAFGSSGINSWERIYLGLPSVVISFADNHKVILKDLVKNNFIHYLGNYKKINKNIIQQTMIKYLEAPERLKLMNQAINSFSLNLQFKSVSSWLFGDLSTYKWKVRRANKSDMKLYWLWVNDPLVKKNSFNKESFSFNDHQKWYSRKISDPLCYLFVVTVDGQSLGQVRFEKIRGFFYIDYAIGRQFRGRGFGSKILEMAIKKFYNTCNDKKISLRGEVKDTNIASSEIFKKLKFSNDKSAKKNIFTKFLR